MKTRWQTIRARVCSSIPHYLITGFNQFCICHSINTRNFVLIKWKKTPTDMSKAKKWSFTVSKLLNFYCNVVLALSSQCLLYQKHVFSLSKHCNQCSCRTKWKYNLISLKKYFYSSHREVLTARWEVLWSVNGSHG